MKTHLRVITESGNSWTSWINGTKAEAEEYYLNKKFNTGVVEDRIHQRHAVIIVLDLVDQFFWPTLF